MLKKILTGVLLAVTMATSVVAAKKTVEPAPRASYEPDAPPVQMPFIRRDPFAAFAVASTPKEEREEKYRRWLAVSVKISTAEGSGSGTIVYFDPRDNTAYVQSCGHLWRGNMDANTKKVFGANKKCKITVWYKNDKKLEQPQEYQADVIYYSNPYPNDVSLVKFKPDWNTWYTPIAPEDFAYVTNSYYRSLGCDGGREVAHYRMRFLGIGGETGRDVVCTENAPRKGRSGGGLMTDDYFIGVCSRSSDPDGTIGHGNGYFTNLVEIRMHNTRNGFGFLNTVGVNWARQIPIVDKNNPQTQYPKDYIPLPGKK